jgi:hypothetical protein
MNVRKPHISETFDLVLRSEPSNVRRLLDTKQISETK